MAHARIDLRRSGCQPRRVRINKKNKKDNETWWGMGGGYEEGSYGILLGFFLDFFG